MPEQPKVTDSHHVDSSNLCRFLCALQEVSLTKLIMLFSGHGHNYLEGQLD